MKKILLSLGAAASIIAPVATVVACGSDSVTFKVTVDQGTMKFAASDTATNEELNKGITTKLVPTADVAQPGPLLQSTDVSKNFPVGPNSGTAHNYSGAVGILNATYENMLGNPETKPTVDSDEAKALTVVENLLKALLMRKDILTNNDTQNLNTQTTAQTVYAMLKALGTEKLSKELNATDTGLTVQAGADKGKKVMFAVDASQVVTISFEA